MDFNFALYYLDKTKVIVESTIIILSSVDRSTQVTSRPDLDDEKNWITIKWPTETKPDKTEAARVLLFGDSYQELELKKELFLDGQDIWTDVQLTGDGPGHGPPPGPNGALGDQPGTTMRELEESVQALSMWRQISSSASSSSVGRKVEMITLPYSDVTVPKEAFQKLDRTNAAKFTKKLAALVFTEPVLAISTRTGDYGEGRVKNGVLKEKRKDKLDEAKVAAIVAAVILEFPGTTVAEVRKAITKKCGEESNKRKKEEKKKEG